MGWGPEKTHTEKRSSELAPSSCGGRMGLGDNPLESEWRRGWCCCPRPCLAAQVSPTGRWAQWAIGFWGRSLSLSLSLARKAHQSRPPPPSGHCEGDCASGILFDVVGEQLEDGDFPENTVGVSLWGRSGGRGEREGLCPRLAKRHCSGCSPGREQLAG